jgi:hypothetical protein
VLATELTKTALTRAMRQRRTYTSWAGERKTRVDLKHSVNGYVMGSTLERPTRLAFHVEMATPSDDAGQRVRRIRHRATGTIDHRAAIFSEKYRAGREMAGQLPMQGTCTGTVRARIPDTTVVMIHCGARFMRRSAILQWSTLRRLRLPLPPLLGQAVIPISIQPTRRGSDTP